MSREDSERLYNLKSVQIRSYFWSVFSRIRTLYLDTFRAVDTAKLLFQRLGKHVDIKYLHTLYRILKKKKKIPKKNAHSLVLLQ